MKDDKSSESETEASAVSCCQFTLYGLIPFTQYEIRLSGLNNAGEGPASQPVLVRTAERGM